MWIGILIFVILILAHEFGHFLAAKRNGVEVEEFGIGFPPKLYGKTFGKKTNKTHYSVNLLPLGGFVRLKGENESDKRKGSFGAASIGVKTKIALAGVGMNALIAIIIFSFQSVTGMPQFFDNQFALENWKTDSVSQVAVVEVVENSPAEQAGVVRGNIIISIGDIAVSNESELTSAVGAYSNQSVELVYQNQGRLNTVQIELSDDTNDGLLGVVPLKIEKTKHHPLVAPIIGVATAGQFTLMTIQGLAMSVASLLSGNFGAAAENVVGPVGIFSIFSSMSDLGIAYLIFFGAILSLTLAVINILPLPALDGGRLTMTYITHFFKLKLSTKKEELIHVSGFIALLVLVVLITIVDIGRL